MTHNQSATIDKIASMNYLIVDELTVAANWHRGQPLRAAKVFLTVQRKLDRNKQLTLVIQPTGEYRGGDYC